MANKIIHKHSSVITDNKAKLPTSEQLDYGELAVNFAAGVETISLKNSSDEIVEFKSNEYYETIINNAEGRLETLEGNQVTESTVSGWGFTKNTGTYSKPTGGIPKTDMDGGVQSSLGKADTASQGYKVFEVNVTANTSLTSVTFNTNPYNEISYEYSANKVLPVLKLKSTYLNTILPLVKDGDEFHGHGLYNNNRIIKVIVRSNNSTISVDTYLQSVPSEYITETELNTVVNNATVELDKKVDKETFNAIVSGDATSAIESFKEVTAFLEGIEDSENLDSIIASIEQQIADIAGRKAYELVDLGSLSKGDNDYYTIDSSVYIELNVIWNKGVLPICRVILNNDTTSVSFIVVKHNSEFIGYAHKQQNGLLHFSLYVDSNGGQIHSHYEQELLKSGENIKTINGESVLGSGDIIISDTKVTNTVNTSTKYYITGTTGNTTNTNTQIFDTNVYVDAEAGLLVSKKVKSEKYEGVNCYASGDNTHAEGVGTMAIGIESHAEGHETEAGGDYSHAEGISTNSIGEASHAEGDETISRGKQSHAEGHKTEAIGSSSHAEGKNTVARGAHSHAEGEETIAGGQYGNGGTYGDNSHAEGVSTKAIADASHAEGWNTQAGEMVDDLISGNYSHAEGDSTKATGWSSHAEGKSTVASGDYSHSEGDQCQALAISSHAEGCQTKTERVSSNGVNVYYAHAEGFGTIAAGSNSHAEGYQTKTYANNSHAEGHFSEAHGDGSHAEGYNTIANSIASHAEGYGTVTNNVAEHACGRYNVSNQGDTSADNTIFSVGIGNESVHKNGLEVRENGDVYIQKDGSCIMLQGELSNVLKQTDVDNALSETSTNPLQNKIIYSLANQLLAQVDAKQDELVSGTNIKTINGGSVLGSGNINLQPTLVSGTNIKRINGKDILGSGNITISMPNMANYYTKSEIDSMFGDINKVLESIVNGGNYGYSAAGYSEDDLLNILNEILA